MRRRYPYERLVDAYTDAHSKLETAYRYRPAVDAKGDSQGVRLFLEKLAQANLSLRLLRALCHNDVRSVLDGAIEKVDKAVRAPPSKAFYKDPEPWLLDAIEAVEAAARREVRLQL